MLLPLILNLDAPATVVPPGPVQVGTTPVTDNTAYSIISGAMWHACLLPEGEDPDSEMLAKHTRKLNQLINFICTKGIRLWLQQDLAITLTAGQGVYSFGPLGTNPMV